MIAFNSDSPHLPRSVLEEAFESLVAHDVVVGRTYDGGYYLVGARLPIRFSRATDGHRSASGKAPVTRARSRVRVGFADPFYDIDVVDDLIRLAAELQRAPARAPRTAVWLEQWGAAITQLRTGTGDL